MLKQGPYNLFYKAPIVDIVELTSIETDCLKLTETRKNTLNKIEATMLRSAEPRTLYTTPFIMQNRCLEKTLKSIVRALKERIQMRGLTGMVKVGACFTHGICWYWYRDPATFGQVEKDLITMIAEKQRLQQLRRRRRYLGLL
jgi:hypothetical protein